MRLFELDDRAVASFDPNNALVFDGGQWRPATIYLARKVLTDGSELTIAQFEALFPSAAATLVWLDIPEPDARPN